MPPIAASPFNRPDTTPVPNRSGDESFHGGCHPMSSRIAAVRMTIETVARTGRHGSLQRLGKSTLTPDYCQLLVRLVLRQRALRHLQCVAPERIAELLRAHQLEDRRLAVGLCLDRIAQCRADVRQRIDAH